MGRGANHRADRNPTSDPGTRLDPARSGWWPGPLDGAAARRRRADVVVVGAGLSGLVAADRLAREGADVVVLEARTRVGGRLETVELAGTAVDLGGCWVGADHTSARVLVGELGLATHRAYESGERVVARRGRIGRGRIGRRLTLSAVERASARLERLAPADATGGPLAWPDAAALDERTLADWLASRSTRWPRGRTVLGDMLTNVIGGDPAELSLLHALWYLRSGGGLAAMTATAGGAQQDFVAGGAQAIADGLAARLGDAVALGAPVRSVECTATAVRVTSDATIVEADRAVLALSPPLLDRIAFSPARPASATTPHRPGDAIKWVAVYEDAFWRREGLSGMAWGDELPFSFTRDASYPSGDPGVLAIFAVGERARRLRSQPATERDELVARGLVRCFGDGAANPIALAARDWTTDRWSLGGYGTTAAPGDWTRAARAPERLDDRILTAGTEDADAHQGYMEGAIRAGERAAAAALARA